MTKIKQDKVVIISQQEVSVDKVNELLDTLETKIEKFANVNGLDTLLGIPDWHISSMCVNALRGELIRRMNNNIK